MSCVEVEYLQRPFQIELRPFLDVHDLHLCVGGARATKSGRWGAVDVWQRALRDHHALL
jgi:hypothetical protein